MTERPPTEAQWADLELAWRVVARVTSNAIVLVKDGQAVGIGCGQQNRADAGRLAQQKAAGRAMGGAYASDAFFPFPDGLDGAIEAGATAVIQPGGSIGDRKVIEAADAARPGHGLHRRAPLPALTLGPSVGKPPCGRLRHLGVIGSAAPLAARWPLVGKPPAGALASGVIGQRLRSAAPRWPSSAASRRAPGQGVQDLMAARSRVARSCWPAGLGCT